jgi:transcription termination factor Rho
MSSDIEEKQSGEAQASPEKASRKRATKKAAAKKTAAKKVARKRVPRKRATEAADGPEQLEIRVPSITDTEVPESYSADPESEPERERAVAEVASVEKSPSTEKDSVEAQGRPAESTKAEKPVDSAEASRDNGKGSGEGRPNQRNGKPFRKGSGRPPQQGGQGGQGGQGKKGGPPPQKSGKRRDKRRGREGGRRSSAPREEVSNAAEWGDLAALGVFSDAEKLNELAMRHGNNAEVVYVEELLQESFQDLRQRAELAYGPEALSVSGRRQLIEFILDQAFARGTELRCRGIVELLGEGDALVVYGTDNYQQRTHSAYLPKALVKRFGIRKGTLIEAQLHPRRKPLPEDALEQLRRTGSLAAEEGSEPIESVDSIAQEALSALFPETLYLQDTEAEEETCPYVLQVLQLMGKSPEENLHVTPFEDLIPYYPTDRIILETESGVKWDNTAMRVVDLLTPVGLGQRGLIVAPPRTGKTILQQAIANAVAVNRPEAHLIILLIDERPEEVTDFRRQIRSGEVVASTFDETPESHVHCAEMVIEKARRMVECGEQVIILLDSITRLARAYNALAANSGKILSGGVEANALQKPKRFFGSARNIEGGGSLTILGTALVETGSRMDEVIFEEFKGTGNMELHLDRALSDKRIFPAIEMAKSGTRKEELLYHPDEMHKVYGLRRAMKGVPPPDAMEMLISRIKKTATNIQFLMGVNT